MTIAERLASSVARHWSRAGAEATDYLDPSGVRVRVSALWDEHAEVDVGSGFRATANVVLVAAADMTSIGGSLRPRIGATVVRNPDSVDGAQEWRVAPEDADGRPLALTPDGYWHIPVERDVRPAGRVP